MAKSKKETKKEDQALVPIVKVQENSLVLEGDPERQVEFAQKAAKALMAVVGTKEKKVIINGKRYLEFDDWQLVARFYGASVAVEWTKTLEDNGKIIGYEARANVLRNSEIIGSAEAVCTKEERNWANRDNFAIKSMAQTRAGAKALRNVFSWVVVMAGYAGTPAEDMGKEAVIQDKVQKAFETTRDAMSSATKAQLDDFMAKMRKSTKYTKEQKDEFEELYAIRLQEFNQE